MAFNRVAQFNGPFNQGFRHDGLRYKLKSFGISGCMGNLRKSIQLMLELLKAPFLLLNFSYYTLMSPFLITLSALTMILHSTRKCAQVSDLRQQLEVAWDLKSDLWDSVDWGRKWIVHFSSGKIQLVSFDQSNNSGAIGLKMNGSAFEELSSFKMLWLSFSCKLDWDSCIISIARTLFMKIGFLICSMNLLFPEIVLYL